MNTSSCTTNEYHEEDQVTVGNGKSVWRVAGVSNTSAGPYITLARNNTRRFITPSTVHGLKRVE